MCSLEEVLDFDAQGDYLDLDDIIVSNAVIPCITEVRLEKVNFLDKSGVADFIEPKTKLDLPCWMVENFAIKKKFVCTALVPKGYQTAERNVLDADATVVSLPHIRPYFYEFGVHLLRLNIRDAEAIGASIITTFRSRFPLIRKLAFGTGSESQFVEKLLRKLDDSEFQLAKLIGESAEEHARCRDRKRPNNPNKLMAAYLRSKRSNVKAVSS